eukprot:365012-Chlamydomonas_euryale.AAC.11
MPARTHSPLRRLIARAPLLNTKLSSVRPLRLAEQVGPRCDACNKLHVLAPVACVGAAARVGKRGAQRLEELRGVRLGQHRSVQQLAQQRASLGKLGRVGNVACDAAERGAGLVLRFTRAWLQGNGVYVCVWGGGGGMKAEQQLWRRVGGSRGGEDLVLCFARAPLQGKGVYVCMGRGGGRWMEAEQQLWSGGESAQGKGGARGMGAAIAAAVAAVANCVEDHGVLEVRCGALSSTGKAQASGGACRESLSPSCCPCLDRCNRTGKGAEPLHPSSAGSSRGFVRTPSTRIFPPLFRAGSMPGSVLTHGTRVEVHECADRLAHDWRPAPADMAQQLAAATACKQTPPC